MNKQTRQPASRQSKKSPRELRDAERAELERLYTFMFGTSGDPEQEYHAYLEYWGVDPRNIVSSTPH